MNVETSITPEMRRDLLALLRAYRAERLVHPASSFEAERQYEKEISERALTGLLQIISRGITPPIDMDVLAAMGALKIKAIDCGSVGHPSTNVVGSTARPDCAMCGGTGLRHEGPNIGRCPCVRFLIDEGASQ